MAFLAGQTLLAADLNAFGGTFKVGAKVRASALNTMTGTSTWATGDKIRAVALNTALGL